MFRTALFALLLIAGGGGPYLGGVVDLVAAAWDADVNAGNHFDPNGSDTDAGSRFDPDGLMGDAGGHFDPNG